MIYIEKQRKQERTTFMKRIDQTPNPKTYETKTPTKKSDYAIKGKRKKAKHPLTFLWIVVILCIILTLTTGKSEALLDSIENEISLSPKTAKLKRYAKKHGLLLSDYPTELIELYERNPETKQFVFEYPLKKDNPPSATVDSIHTSSVPLLFQWDQRWGYEQYAGNFFGLTGCGPTCLSMVSIYLTGDTTMTPISMAKFAESNGYASNGNGSSWTLFSEGGVKLGFDVTEIPFVEKRIIDNLNVGNPIVAIMGPGDFTTTGHFIVLTGYKNGKIQINDPNSRKNSKKLWDLSKIKGQTRNLWVFRSGS